MKYLYKILLFALVLAGCYSDKGYEPEIDYSHAVPKYRLSGPSELPLCSKSLEGTVIYMSNDLGSIYACSDGLWTKMAELGYSETKYDDLEYFNADSVRKSIALDGNDIPPPVYDMITDVRDGKNYKIVRIDGEWWFAENLDFVTGKSVHFEDDVCEDKCGVGYYYEDAVNACPKGFHLSTKSEWYDLIEYVGGKSYAGIALKAEGDYWYGDARNTVGFSALPVDIDYYSVNCYWTASDNVLFDINGYEVEEGSNVASQRKCSVRCVED
jgi:uncharacterized protein (TIGR02145 family)